MSLGGRVGSNGGSGYRTQYGSFDSNQQTNNCMLEVSIVKQLPSTIANWLNKSPG